MRFLSFFKKKKKVSYNCSPLRQTHKRHLELILTLGRIWLRFFQNSIFLDKKKYRPSVKKKRKADRQKFTTAHPLFKDVLSHCEKTQDVVVVVVCDIIF